jgi:hypothetical protein
LLFRRHYRRMPLFTIFVGGGRVFSLIYGLHPTWETWMLLQVVNAALRFGVALELTYRLFGAFPGAAATNRYSGEVDGRSSAPPIPPAVVSIGKPRSPRRGFSFWGVDERRRRAAAQARSGATVAYRHDSPAARRRLATGHRVATRRRGKT